jgi:hypothetical protein
MNTPGHQNTEATGTKQRTPDIETFKQKLRTKELDIFMSDRYLVTIHDEHF